MLKVLQINAMNNGNTGFIAENIKTKCIDAGSLWESTITKNLISTF